MSEELRNKKRNGWETVTEGEKNDIFQFSEEYIYFLNQIH